VIRWTIGLALAVLVAVIATNTLTPGPRWSSAAQWPDVPFDEAAAVEHLAAAVRIPTISRSGEDADADAFAALHAALADAFPLVHAQLGREVIGAHALLYTWNGSDASLRPAIIMGHQDVVPVDPATAENWTHPPFSGAVSDGMVWGRGTMDDKSTVLGALEAAEALLRSGFEPQRTLLFAFGDDEEIGGENGAVSIVDHLKGQGVQAEFVIDEGGSLTRGLMPGVDSRVAMIGIAEKGYLTLRLTVDTVGGHSSMPPPEGAIGILAAALARLQADPFPTRMTDATTQMLDATAGQQSLPMRAVMRNRWLTAPLIRHVLARQPSTAATIRTTMALTMFDAGVKDNVLPTRARATVNLRLLPGDSIEDVMARVSSVVADERIGIEIADEFGGREASPISSTDSFGFKVISSAIAGRYPDAVIAPYLVLGGTDSSHYTPLTDQLFRFTALDLEPRDLERIHGIDERVAVEAYLDSIRFMTDLIRSAAHPG